MKTLNKNWIEELKEIKKLDLNTFLDNFKGFSSYNEREEYLKKFSNDEMINILSNEDFIKLFYLDAQAKYLMNSLNYSDLKILSNLVYCYNTNEREYKKTQEENILKAKAISEGYTEGNIFNIEELKKLDKLKVFCIMDISKIGLLGSFDSTETKEGTFNFINHNNGLMLIPKGSRTRGHLITNRFYYKIKYLL
jgi:hypothetical protein